MTRSAPFWRVLSPDSPTLCSPKNLVTAEGSAQSGAAPSGATRETTLRSGVPRRTGSKPRPARCDTLRLSRSDRDHFEYRASHALPVVAVVFDPDTQVAFWADITDHLRQHPSAITEGPYVIAFLPGQELSDRSFVDFREHCLRYRDQYSREPNFGRALESLSTREEVERCFDGLRALFAYHRQQAPTWYYFISCLSNYKEHPILRALIARLCHIPGHGDIFWSKVNLIDEDVRRNACNS